MSHRNLGDIRQNYNLKMATSNPTQTYGDRGRKQKKLTTQMQGHVGKLFETYGFIQPSTIMPSAVKSNQVYFNVSTVEGPDVKSGSFVSFTLNCRYPDRPFAISVKVIPKDSPQRFPVRNVKCFDKAHAVSAKKILKDSSAKAAYTPSFAYLDGLLNATVISVSGKSGFMKHKHDLPPPYNHNKVVQFVTPDGILDKVLTKGQQAVFTVDQSCQKKLVAKDVAFAHTSYDPKTTIPYVGESCDHICFRNKGDVEGVLACQKNCSRELMCTHVCPKKCYEECPKECKQCRKQNKCGK